MDILKPKLVWIGYRCYRKNESLRQVTQSTAEAEDYFDGISSSETVRCEGDENSNIPEGIMTKDGQYELEIEIPSALCGHVVGFKGATKKRLESETGTKIFLPRINVDAVTVIRAPTRQKAERAYLRIQTLVDAARSRHPATHFISFPLTTIAKRYEEFQELVMERCEQDHGIRRELFQKPLKLHMTIGIMVLLSEFERKKAAQLLQECSDSIVKTILGGKKLTVKVKGLECMNDDLSEVHVLYAKVTPGGNLNKLQQLADALVDNFVVAGLMEKQRHNVKLHLTLMNSTFVNWLELGHTKSQQNRFDARRIVKEFMDFDFGEAHIDSIHLSQRHTTSKTGYYCATAEILL